MSLVLHCMTSRIPGTLKMTPTSSYFYGLTARMWMKARRVDAEHGAYVSLKYNIAKQRGKASDVKGKFIFKNHIGRFH